jgi:hypothetical protein
MCCLPFHLCWNLLPFHGSIVLVLCLCLNLSACGMPLWAGDYMMLRSVVVLCVHMAELSKDYSLLSWNVRGLNNQEKREDVWQMIQLHKPMIVCLHETKLHNVSASIVSQC